MKWVAIEQDRAINLDVVREVRIAGENVAIYFVDGKISKAALADAGALLKAVGIKGAQPKTEETKVPARWNKPKRQRVRPLL